MAFGKPKEPKEKPTKPVKEKPVKEPKASNKKVKNPRKLAEKFEQELSEVAKRLGIRVSAPYGYYPEDVDKIILGLEDEISNLTKDNMKLKDEYNKAKANEMSLQTEYQALKMQMSLAEYPDASMEQASAIFDRVPTLSGRDPSGGSNVPVPKPNKISTPLKLKVAGGDNPPQKDEPTTFSNLIKPRNKNKGE